jgi:alpha-L-fucosidase 2
LWSTGSVQGLCARGGFEVDMEWDEGILKSGIIFSKNGGTCIIRMNNRDTKLTLKVGEKQDITKI